MLIEAETECQANYVWRMQIAALVFYIVCGLIKLGFVANFVIIIVCLMLDFWIVSPILQNSPLLHLNIYPSI